MSTRFTSYLSRNFRTLLRAPTGLNVDSLPTNKNRVRTKRDIFCKELFIPHTCVQNDSEGPCFVKAVDLEEEVPQDATENELKHDGFMEVKPGKTGILEYSYSEFLHKMRVVMYKENGEKGKVEKFGEETLRSNNRIIIS